MSLWSWSARIAAGGRCVPALSIHKVHRAVKAAFAGAGSKAVRIRLADIIADGRI
jgi:hypothetical protein